MNRKNFSSIILFYCYIQLNLQEKSSLKLQTRNKRRENVLSVTAMLRLQTSTVTQRQTAGWLSYSSVNVFLDITDNRYMLGI